MRKLPAPLGVTVMPEWFQAEGVEAVLDRVQALGATAIATSPYVMEPAGAGEGAREPPPDGEAGRVRPLDRALWGRRELFIRTAPSFAHDLARYAGLRYRPGAATALTAREGPILDRAIEAAAARGIAVYLQVMAASPPGYRVQFSQASDDDQCLGPDGMAHPGRVDRNASLASPHVVAYLGALLAELAARYPAVAGFRLDWPEYPPYDFRSALFDFHPGAQRLIAEAGHDPPTIAAAAAALARELRDAASAQAAQGPAAVRNALVAAGWGTLFDPHGPLAPLFAAKRRAALALLRAARSALDTVPGPRRRLEPQAFPPPFHAISGFPLTDLAGVADRVGIKLYTMHWPMLARYWARDLAPGAGATEEDHVTAAIAALLGFTDEAEPDGRLLRYPEPDTAHPVGTRAQADKLAAAAAASPVPTLAFVHTYGPPADVVNRYRIAAASAAPIWLNRYGYLSDAKLAALAER